MSKVTIDPGLKFLYKEDRLRRKQGQSSTGRPASEGPRSGEIRDVADVGASGGGSGMASLVESGSESEQWTAALSNFSEINTAISALQNLLIGKAVYADEEAFSQASAQSTQFRLSKAQERRIRDLQKELDAAVSASRHSRNEKKLAESLQRQAEARVHEVLRELEDTTEVFKLHREELRLKQEELGKRDAEIRELQIIIESLRNEPRGSKSKKHS